MNADLTLFSESFTEALTFTLLHSLWQGLAIVLLLRAVLLFVAGRNSGFRYATTAIALTLMFVTSITTFFIVFDPAGESLRSQFANATPSITITNGLSGSVSILQETAGLISFYKDYITIAWLSGAFVFMLRFVGGYAYLHNLKRRAKILNNEWSIRVVELSKKLEIRARITLAESTRVFSPMVIGLVKPFIIIPAGLSSGLTADQLEAIFIHELVHIKRNDYLLNLFQTLLEAVFFFNPSVWILSSILRTEREHCCDDAVVTNGANAKAYVHALAALEHSRINHSLAISLKGNRNELLERIKRLMEKSTRNYSLKERVVPVLFLFVGLICASWFTIQRSPETRESISQDKVNVADTTIRKKQKSASYSKKKITVVTPGVAPKEQVVEEFKGDEELHGMMSGFSFNDDFVMPPMPPVGFDFVIPPVPDMVLYFDSIPPFRRGHQDWSNFEREFTQEFQERFGDFYNKNQGEFQKMMEQFQEKFNSESLADIEAMAARDWNMDQHAVAMEQHEKAFRDHEVQMKKFEEEMRNWEAENATNLKVLEGNLKIFEEKMKSFEKELKVELIRDGYIDKEDAIRHLHWDDNGEIEINGKKIEEKHIEKYRAMHEKFFGKEHGGDFHYSE